MMNPHDLFQRALRAYTRHSDPTAIHQQPSSCASGMEEVNGDHLFVLRNLNGPLMAFTVKPNGWIGKRVELPIEGLAQ